MSSAQTMEEVVRSTELFTPVGDLLVDPGVGPGGRGRQEHQEPGRVAQLRLQTLRKVVAGGQARLIPKHLKAVAAEGTPEQVAQHPVELADAFEVSVRIGDEEVVSRGSPVRRSHLPMVVVAPLRHRVAGRLVRSAPAVSPAIKKP